MKLLQKHPDLASTLDKTFSLLVTGVDHPYFRLHKLKNQHPPTWSISLGYDLRVLFVYVRDGILIVDIGTHDQVYGK